MPVEKVGIENAKPDKLFYFVANAVVFRESDRRCLILKRSEREVVHPGKWTVPGGKLEHKDLDIKNPTSVDGEVLNYDDAVEELVRREVHEEAGIEVEMPLMFIGHNTFVRPDGTPVVMMKFAVKYLSGEVVPEPGAFTNFAWVNEVEVSNYDCIGGVPAEVAKAIGIFSTK